MLSYSILCEIVHRELFCGELTTGRWPQQVGHSEIILASWPQKDGHGDLAMASCPSRGRYPNMRRFTTRRPM